MQRTSVLSISLLLSLLLFLALTGCQPKSAPVDPNVDYYTCTMHPSVHSQDAHGKCPICGMNLVPVLKKGATQAATGPQLSEFSVAVERQQQIGVTYATAEKRPFFHVIRSVGLVAADRTKHWEFVARVEGYVQKLHVTSAGERVEEGQPLLTIYSPELSTAEREFINLLDARDRSTSPEARTGASRSIEAAHRRLEQWNITPAQIAELEKTRKPSEFLTLNSPFKGIVESVPVDQGRKLAVGDHLVDVADLSVVWVWSEFYEDELSMLKKGQKVRVTSKAYPGENFEGELSLVDPFVAEMKRTARMRIDLPNADYKLRPGMYVNVELAMTMGEGLTIPVSAVMPTGQRSLVFLDKGEGKLEPRFVQLGRKYGELYEVIEGLKSGERVVASANFLIDAESKIQGAVKLFEEPVGDQTKLVELSPEAARAYGQMFTSYLAIQKGLAADDFSVIAKHLAKFREQVDALLAASAEYTYRQKLESVKAAAAALPPADLEQARIYFGKVSAPLIVLASALPPPGEEKLHVQHCPMWEKSPADWIQVGDKIENPFFGSKMPDCGAMVKPLEAAR